MLEEIQITQLIPPLLSWYERAKRPLPWRGTRDPYRIWVSEIMLQQTRIEAVIPYYHRFMDTLPDIASLADCPEDALMKLWEGLGYYSRARNLKKAALRIVEEFGGKMPADHERILSLPGIGPYTAGAIASIAFNLPHPAIDGNVLRVIARVSDDSRNVLGSELKKELTGALQSAMEEVSANNPGYFNGALNQALMELGEHICLPNGIPRCEDCPWRDLCLARERDTVSALPVRIKKTARRVEHRTIILVVDGKRILIKKREETGLLAGLYEPFNLPGSLDENKAVEAVRGLQLDPLHIEALPDARHLFSHIEWRMNGFLVKVADAHTFNEEGGYFFVEMEALRKHYSIPGAYAKFMQFL